MKNIILKTLYKSQLNYDDLFVFPSLLGLFCWLGCSLTESFVSKFFVIVITLILLYFSLRSTVYQFLFNVNDVRIVFYFKVRNRIKIIQYKDIEEVKYLNNTGYRLPTIVFVYKGTKYSRLLKSSNSFTHRRFSKRKEILTFLHEKGIPIYVDSWSKKDREIFGKTENVTYNKKWL